MKLTRLIMTGMLLLLLTFTAGCNQGAAPETSGSASSGPAASSGSGDASKAAAKELSVTVYYPNEDGTKLLPVSKKVTLSEGGDPYTAAMGALLEGTKGNGMVNILPKEAKLRSVKVNQGIATVDFNAAFVKKFTGGSTGESLLVGSIVDTLTEFPEIKAVQIIIEGEPVETIAGHMDTSVPIKRMKDLL